MNKTFRIFQQNIEISVDIGVSEVKEALKHMKAGKACGPDGIPIKVWKSLGESGVVWLKKLFNAILKESKMPNAWRKSVLIPIYKNKGDN